jgi:cytosolic carboxypeptidase protein 2/3
MNPTLKKTDLQFDSNFECGNLDLAILVSPVEYDLLMRVDSNTKGHTTWFFFKVTNFSHQQKVKFNLINF